MILKDQREPLLEMFFIIRKKSDFEKYYDKNRCQILQEYVSSKTTKKFFEFTSSFFKTIDGKILGPYVGKRKLVNGHSWIVETKIFQKLKII